MSQYDAIVIGAGPNGLVAATMLADADWSTRVLESQPSPGGAVRSANDVHPDFVHDTMSSFYPLAAASPVRGLYLGSSSAHPGGGVHGAAGSNAARAAIAHRRLSRR